MQDSESYQKLIDAAELVETLQGIKKGLEQMKQGEGKKAEDFFHELFEKVEDRVNVLFVRHIAQKPLSDLEDEEK
ncbi:MAG: hypothetical protein RLZZ04_527 [Cyanobacteriota bacterium]